MSEFINAGLVDDIYFVMGPVLFGSGLPLLKNVELESKLNLLEVMKLNDNTIQLHYRNTKAILIWKSKPDWTIISQF